MKMVDNKSSNYFTRDLSANIIDLEKVEVSGKIKALGKCANFV